MKQYMKYVKPYALYFLLAPVLMLVEVVGEVFMPKFLANIIDEINAGIVHVLCKNKLVCLEIVNACAVIDNDRSVYRQMLDIVFHRSLGTACCKGELAAVVDEILNRFDIFLAYLLVVVENCAVHIGQNEHTIKLFHILLQRL